jgi:hypothetical protein
MMSSLIFRLVLIPVLCLALLLMLCLISLMDLTIAYMILVHERTALCLDALVMAHVLIVVIVPRVGPVFHQEGFTPILSRDTWMVHVFPVVVVVSLMQKIVKTSSGRMVNYWIPKIYLTNPSTESSTFSCPMSMMDGGLEGTWLMDSGCSRHMTENKKWFSNLTPLSHKKYVTFGDDKKFKVLGTGIIKINDYFTLNDFALVDRLRYNLLSVSQLVDADLDVLFRKSDSHVLDSSGKRVYGIFHIRNVFQADFSFAQSSLRCLILKSSSEL